MEDYNYFINKAINQYINKTYNTYDVNQQKTDDLRVLKGTAVLEPTLQTIYPTIIGNVSNSPLYMATYDVTLPDDYLHILNCLVEYKVLKRFKCYDPNTYVHFGAKRLTADMMGQIINNYFMRPSYDRPYYYINNVNITNKYPTSDTQIEVTANSSTPYLTDALSISNPAGLIEGYINQGIYRLNSNNFVRVNDFAKPIDLGTIGDFTNQLVSATRTSGKVDNLCQLQNLTSPTFFSDLGITIGSTIVSTFEQFTIDTDTYPASTSSLDTVLAVIPYSTGQAIILDNGGLLLSDTNLVKIYAFNTPYIEALGYNANIQTANKNAELRYGNRSEVRMEIRFGKDDKVFQPSRIYVDYLKAPQFIRLTQDQVDTVEDNSQILEFPDYVVQEIINELTKILMENASDPRLQTHIPVNQSVASPQQEQQQRK